MRHEEFRAEGHHLKLQNSAFDLGQQAVKCVPRRSRSLFMAMSDAFYQSLAFLISLFSLLFR
jgi:hypothetical protein